MASDQSRAGMRGASLAALCLAATCGWIIMEMEILGARILQPYFGGSISVVMGSVIGVFLLSLAVGYLLGGRLSRRPGSRPLLGAAVAAAGVWLCALPWMVEPVCDAIFGTGLDDKWGSLTSALALFAVPTVLLGTVSPTVVRWTTKRAEESGARAGTVLAISTAASFFGCIITAFYLVRLSIRITVCTSGVALVLAGAATMAAGWLGPRKEQ